VTYIELHYKEGPQIKITFVALALNKQTITLGLLDPRRGDGKVAPKHRYLTTNQRCLKDPNKRTVATHVHVSVVSTR